MASKQLVRKMNLCVSIRFALTALMLSSAIGCATVSDLTSNERFALTPNTEDFRSRLYAGASVGTSQVNPDTSGTQFNVESDSDGATQLRLGYDHHNRLNCKPVPVSSMLPHQSARCSMALTACSYVHVAKVSVRTGVLAPQL